MVTTKLNLSMTEPSVRQIYAKQGDTGRVLDIALDQTPEDGTLRILRPDGVEVTSEAVTGGEVESGGTFESLTEADVTELSVGIEPVQDLNGYDKPWVGGAGKNLLNYDAWKRVSMARGTAIFENNGVTLTATDTDCYTGYRTDQFPQEAMIQVTEGETVTLAWDATPTNIGGVYIFPNAQSSGMVMAHSDIGHLSYTVASGVTFITFRVGVSNSGVTVSYKNIQIVRGTTVPTWQPYSNICPITGHDEAEVTQTGKNLCTQTGVNNTVIGQAKQGTTYTFSIRNQGSCGYNIKKNNNSGATVATTGGLHPTDAVISVTFTADEDCNLFLNGFGKDGYTFLRSAYDYQLELGSTATSYEPYRSNTYTTSLGQTVYGGTLDMVTGVLTVDKAKGVLSASIISSMFLESGHLYRVTTPSDSAPFFGKVSGYPNPSEMKCNWYNTFGTSYSDMANTAKDHMVAISGDAGTNLLISESSITSTEDLRNRLASNPIELVYPLASPVQYQLTPQQIKTLVGTNNVWASSGDIVSIKFTYGGLLSELPSDATSVVGKCYCDVEQNGVSSMPFTLNVKKNERAT